MNHGFSQTPLKLWDFSPPIYQEMERLESLLPLQIIKSGFFYLGIEAKHLGLVDEFGGRDEAIIKAKELAGIEDGKIIEYKPKKTIIDVIEGFTNKAFFYMGKGMAIELPDNKFEILAM